MYIPGAFREDQIKVLHEIIRRNSFGTVISCQDGELIATHLPILMDRSEGSIGTLFGHMARANHQWKCFRREMEVLVMFQGPHAYISPSWYETEESVPTWNYVSVHAYGTPEIIEEKDPMLNLLRRTVSAHESGFSKPWTIDQLSDEFVDKMISAIVGFKIPIARLEGKLKLNQNRSVADQRGVIKALVESGDAMATDVARMMDDNVKALERKGADGAE